jgi:hypothetical protein
MEKTQMTVYQSTSDASHIYHKSSGMNAIPANGSADCGNVAAFTANGTFLAPQTIYIPLTLVPAIVAPPRPRPLG